MALLQTKGLPELEIGADRWVSKPGRYGFVIVEAKEAVTNKGMGSIKLRCQTETPSDPINNGISFWDDLVIEGETSAYFKKRLRQLGVPVESDNVSGEQICAHLLGKHFFADLGLEPQMTKESNYTQPKKMINEQGQETIVYKCRPTAYYQTNTSAVVAPAPTQVQHVAAPVVQAPQGFGAAPAGFGAPPPGFGGVGATAPAGFPQAPQGFPAANGGAPAGFGAVPAPAPWATTPPEGGQVDTSGAPTGGKGRKAKG